MMHDQQKSDSCIVARKPTNKLDGAGAEPVERRREAKGNTGESCAHRTQSRVSVLPRLERVRERAKLRRSERFTSLLHHIDVDLLRWAYSLLKRDAAPGVDGLTWQQYGEHLEKNLSELHARVHSGAYRPQPSRRTFIAKADGRQRPLGIAAVEDKVLQRAVMALLNAIYEVDFRGFSYGFRPGRSQHDALDALATGITRRKVSWILDADIESFFDSVSHDWLIRFLEHRIGDRRVVRLIHRWLKAGVMEAGVPTPTHSGTPQGAVISPLLANVYLHYVFDLWAHRWRGRQDRGAITLVRFADDIVVGFEREADARGFQADLRERLRDFALTLHPQKTRLIEFGRFAAANRARVGQKKPATFNFLGFTHICGRTRCGGFLLTRKTRGDRMRNTLRALKEEMRVRRHYPLAKQGRWLRHVVAGYFNYHAVPTNWFRMAAFRHHVIWLWWRSLRRRSQRDCTSWWHIHRLAKRWLPRVRIRHPWPEQRFRVKYPRWEPSARIVPARICVGGAQQ
jgi:RNA-directed DNA polymerase